MTYARAWINDCQGRTDRGFDEDTRASYDVASSSTRSRTSGRHRCARSTGRRSTRLRKAPSAGPRADLDQQVPRAVRALFSDAVGNGHLTANPALRLAINAKVSTADARR